MIRRSHGSFVSVARKKKNIQPGAETRRRRLFINFLFLEALEGLFFAYKYRLAGERGSNSIE